MVASGFTEKKFRDLHIGMTKSEVLDSLGRPLGRCRYTWLEPGLHPNKGFLYAMPAGRKEYIAYHWREVVFDRKDRVARVYSADIRPSFFQWFMD